MIHACQFQEHTMLIFHRLPRRGSNFAVARRVYHKSFSLFFGLAAVSSVHSFSVPQPARHHQFYSTTTTILNMLPKTTTTLSFDDQDDSSAFDTTLILGKPSVLQTNGEVLAAKLGVPAASWAAMADAAKKPGSTTGTFVGTTKVTLGALPETVSRHNHPWAVHDITAMVASSLSKNKKNKVIFCGDSALDYAGALCLAVGKAFPVYSQKTAAKKENDSANNDIAIAFWNDKGEPQTATSDVQTAASASVYTVQLAQRWVDMPPQELTTDQYAEECQELCQALNQQLKDGGKVEYSEIVGADLDAKGYGGIFGVGKAATCPPRLAIMEFTPANAADDAAQTCLVGKAIVYDTGGLSLKPKVGMCGMKGDMGGSAGVMGGFAAAVMSNYPNKLTCLLCMAENAIGPEAFRNDDILTLYSGKTVEINNCDAEGRLVLGDGVAHATKHVTNVNLVVDMATLTGAQGVATGQKHGAILANTPELEQEAVAAGLQSGDLAYPLLYAPDILMQEFDSKVADMKNSVKDRSNAQSSCAGHFIEAHLNPDYKGGWLHVDMAGPSESKERGTGYGVGLVLSLLKVPGF